MHEKTIFLFIITLIGYLFILDNSSTEVKITVSAFVLPLLSLMILILRFTKPKKEPRTDFDIAMGFISRGVKQLNNSQEELFDKAGYFFEIEEETRPDRRLIQALESEKLTLRVAVGVIEDNTSKVAQGEPPIINLDEYLQSFSPNKEGDELPRSERIDSQIDDEGKRVIQKYRNSYCPPLYCTDHKKNDVKYTTVKCALIDIDREIKKRKKELENKKAQMWKLWEDSLVAKTNNQLNWNEWIKQNKNNLAHPAGFEEKFVERILSKIPEISPDDVKAQYPFKDSKGTGRQIDFAIINQAKGYCLPIELDGYEKMQTGYLKFNDFLERQNDLVKQFGIILRYTNKKMFNEPKEIIKEIRDTLRLQSEGKITDEMIDENYKEAIHHYKGLIEHLEKEKETEQKAKIAEKIAREIADKERDEEEQKRIIAEKEKLIADEKAAEAEQKRIIAEQEKLAADEKAAEAEQKRIEAEQEKLISDRQIAEVEQKQLEAEKKIAKEEQRRITAEQKQLEADSKRAEEEQKRIKAEHKQLEAEQRQLEAERKIAEEQRKRIESEQKQLEIEKKMLEVERKSVEEEQKRIEAEIELEREKEISEDIGAKIRDELKSFFKLPYLIMLSVAVVAVGYFMWSQNNAPKNQVPISQSPIAVAPVNEPIAQSHPVMTTQTEDDSMPSIFDSAITPWTAKTHIGDNIPVCGYVAEVKKFSKGVYLNFEKRYPNQPFSAVIWDSNYSLIQKSSQFAKTELCVTGKISTYKGNPRISINSERQIVQ